MNWDLIQLKLHRCQPGLWFSRILKHEIWGKIHIHLLKFRHLEEFGAWGTCMRNKARTAEPLKQSRRHVWSLIHVGSLISTDYNRNLDTQGTRVHTYMETATSGGQLGWLYLEMRSSSPWSSDSPKVMLKVSARLDTKPALLEPSPTFQVSPEFSFQFQVYTA